jgi:dihydroorotase
MLKLKGGHIVDPKNGIDKISDILIDDGKITKISKSIDINCEEIDVSGKYVFPGLVDIHVHLRDFEQSAKEDIISGASSAAAGGVTSLVAMPNTVPAVDSPEMLKKVYEKAEKACVRVYQAAAISKGIKGVEALDLKKLAQCGAAAFSDDGRPVVDSKIMLNALKYAKELGKPVLAHCEDLYLAKGGIINEGAVSRKLGVCGLSAAAEDAGTAREITLAEDSGCPVHICHVSTLTSVNLIRDAKARGVMVTAETAPHYFTLTENDVLCRNADFRMNPPLRTESDKMAIIYAIKSGIIDCIATDHAPHTDAEKSDFEKAPNGSIGMETSLSVSFDALVRKEVISVSKLVELMSYAPAKIANLPAGSLSVGGNADIVVFDPEYEWTVDRNKLHGKSHNTPFHGKTLKGKVVLTMVGGKTVYKI